VESWEAGRGCDRVGSLQLINCVYLVAGVHHREWGGLAGVWEDVSQSADPRWRERGSCIRLTPVQNRL
jgi:hypothetical protein